MPQTLRTGTALHRLMRRCRHELGSPSGTRPGAICLQTWQSLGSPFVLGPWQSVRFAFLKPQGSPSLKEGSLPGIAELYSARGNRLLYFRGNSRNRPFQRIPKRLMVPHILHFFASPAGAIQDSPGRSEARALGRSVFSILRPEDGFWSTDIQEQVRIS